MSILSNIFSLKNNDISILTFPADTYLDSYWDYCEYPVYMLASNKMDYVPNVNLIYSDQIASYSYSHIVVHESRYDEAIKLSRLLHIPLILLKTGEIKKEAHYIIDMLLDIGPPPKTEDYKAADFLLCREEYVAVLRQNGFKAEKLAFNYEARLKQYSECSGLVSFYKDLWLPELREAEYYNLPALTLSNKFHKNIPVFSNINEIKQKLEVYNTNSPLYFDRQNSIINCIKHAVSSVRTYLYV